MKTEILTLLRETDGYVSGQELCEKFGVSRTAVWKAINQLKEAGYEIEAVQNKGYRLVSVPDILSESELQSVRKTRWIGEKIAFFDVDGTMINVPHQLLKPTDKTIHALKEFQKQGNYIVVALSLIHI